MANLSDIEKQLNTLASLRTDLYTNLTNKGVTGLSADDTYNTLVPAVNRIQEQTLPQLKVVTNLTASNNNFSIGIATLNPTQYPITVTVKCSNNGSVVNIPLTLSSSRTATTLTYTGSYSILPAGTWSCQAIATATKFISAVSNTVTVTVAGTLAEPVITLAGTIISWNPVEHASTYQVAYATSASGSKTVIVNSQTAVSYNFSTWLDSQLAGTYYFFVKCNTNAPYAASEWSNSVSYTKALPQLAAPTNVAVSGGQITFTASANATSYDMYSNDVFKANVSGSPVTIADYFTESGTYIVNFVAKASGYQDSPHSANVTVTVGQQGKIYISHIWTNTSVFAVTYDGVTLPRGNAAIAENQMTINYTGSATGEGINYYLNGTLQGSVSSTLTIDASTSDKAVYIHRTAATRNLVNVCVWDNISEDKFNVTSTATNIHNSYKYQVNDGATQQYPMTTETVKYKDKIKATSTDWVTYYYGITIVTNDYASASSDFEFYACVPIAQSKDGATIFRLTMVGA